MRVDIRPRRWARRQWMAIGVVTGLSLIGQTIRLVFHHDRLYGLIRQFSLGGESNVPSWYQGVTLLVAGALFGLIASIERREGRNGTWRWILLSAGFVVMSLDEIATLH